MSKSNPTSGKASAPQSAGAPAAADSAEKAAPTIEALQAQIAELQAENENFLKQVADLEEADAASLQEENEALAAENAALKAEIDSLTVASGKPLIVNVGKQAYALHGKAVTLSRRKGDDEATQALYGTHPIQEAAKNEALLEILVARGHGQLVPVEA